SLEELIPELDTSKCSLCVVLAVTFPAVVTLTLVRLTGVYLVLLPIWNVNDCPPPVVNALCKFPITYLLLFALEIDPVGPNESVFAPVFIFPAVNVRLLLIVATAFR